MEIWIAVISLVSALVGGSLTALIQYYVGLKTEVKSKAFQYKEARYKAITILMYTRLFPERLGKITSIRPDLKTVKDLEEELHAELFNLLIFSNDNVVKSFRSFLDNPSENNFQLCAEKIRDDLW